MVSLSLLKWHKEIVIFCFQRDTNGWVGRWCCVASSAGASYYFGIWQGRALLCLRKVRDGWLCFILFIFFFFLISSIQSSFSNASSVGRLLNILKYCGLGRSNPALVVSYYRRRTR